MGVLVVAARPGTGHLAKRGWLEGEDEPTLLSERAGRDDGLDAVRMSSITYRIATGKQAGRKVATQQTLPAADAGPIEGDAGKAGGFSLHAGVAAQAHESKKLDKLCRYIARPRIAAKAAKAASDDAVNPNDQTPE